MIPKVIVDSTVEPITIEECRSHLNLYAYGFGGTHPDDSMIMMMLRAAREQCEEYLGRSITVKTYEIALDRFPGVTDSTLLSRPILPYYDVNSSSLDRYAIELPMPPLVEVVSITTGGDTDGLLSSAEYVVDDYSMVPKVVPVTAWPTITPSKNNIIIRYRAGYESLPYTIRAAMLFLLGTFYANREHIVIPTRGVAHELPDVLESLLRPLRVRTGMA